MQAARRCALDFSGSVWSMEERSHSSPRADTGGAPAARPRKMPNIWPDMRPKPAKRVGPVEDDEHQFKEAHKFKVRPELGL